MTMYKLILADLTDQAGYGVTHVLKKLVNCSTTEAQRHREGTPIEANRGRRGFNKTQSIN